MTPLAGFRGIANMEDKPGINSALSRLPDSALIDLGEKWISDKATHTRSLAAFSIVVNPTFHPS